MTDADRCKQLAKDLGSWSRAYEQIYGADDITAKEYAVRLRANGWSIRHVAVLCRLRYGVGSNQSVMDWTSTEQYKKHLARNAKYKRRR